MTKFFKKSKRPYFGGYSGPFLANMNFPGKKCSASFYIFQLSTIVPKIRKSEKTNKPFLRKMLSYWTDRNSDFIEPFLRRVSSYENNLELS